MVPIEPFIRHQWMPTDAEFGWLQRQPPSLAVQLVLLKRNTINNIEILPTAASFMSTFIQMLVSLMWCLTSCQLIIRLKKILLSKDSASQYKLQSR